MFTRIDDIVVQPYWLNAVGRTISFWRGTPGTWRITFMMASPVTIVDALGAPDDFLFIDKDLCLCDKWTLLRTAGTMPVTVRREDIFPASHWRTPIVSMDLRANWLPLEFHGEVAGWVRLTQLMKNGIAMVGKHRCYAREE